MTKKGKGWYGHIPQHILAGKGISTSFGKSKYKDMKKKLSQETDDYVDIKPPKELRNIYWDQIGDNFNPSDTENAIMLYWWCSTNDKWDWFNFEEFLNQSAIEIKEWFLNHYEDDKYRNMLNDDLSNWEEVQKRSMDDKSDIAINTLVNTFGKEVPKNMYEMYKKTKKCNNCSFKEKINIIDEIIHTEHQSGNIFEVPISHLREYFEDEYL